MLTGRATRTLFRSLLALLIVLTWTGIAAAQSGPTIVRVEEDWELVVAAPDVDSDSPQVTCVISPVGHVEAHFAAFELNHQSLPSFTPGGLQLQVWEGEVALSDRHFPNPAVMMYPAETVTWTQTIDLADGLLTFEVISGDSTTWGKFGGQGYLKASIPTTLSDLNAYDSAVSVAHSGVGYAANRVVLLVLKEVRFYTSTGEQLTDSTDRVVHSQD